MMAAVRGEGEIAGSEAEASNARQTTLPRAYRGVF